MSSRLPLRSIGSLTALNLIGGGLGMFQTIVLAWLYGASRTVEVYFAATTFQELLLNLAVSGQIGDLFTPKYHSIQASHGIEAARRAFCAMSNTMVGVAILLVLVADLLAWPIVKLLVPGFTLEEQILCWQVFLSLSPVLVLQIANSMLNNLLRADHHYGTNERLSLIARCANIVVWAAFGPWFGLWALVIGVWLANIIQITGQLIYLYRQGFHYSPVLVTSEFTPRSVIIQIPLVFQHVFASQFFAFALSAGLSFLPEGAMAVYGYAHRLSAKLNGILLAPIGVVFFNKFSQIVAAGKAIDRKLVEHAISLTVAIAAIDAAVMTVSGDLVFWILWGGEKFNQDQIRDATMLVIAYALHIAMTGHYLIARRTNLALGFAQSQYLGSGVVLFVCGVLCYVLIPRWGLYGAIAIDTIAMLGNSGVSYWVTRAKRPEFAVLPNLRSFLSWTFYLVIAICIGLGLRHWFAISLEMSKPMLLLHAIWLALVTLLTLMGIAAWMGEPESKELVERYKAKILGHREPS